MKLQEFIFGEIMDLHSWVDVIASRIQYMIDTGELPNNPDSIKNAAKQAALACRDDTEQIDAGMIADEVERRVSNKKITKKAHLGGQIA